MKLRLVIAALAASFAIACGGSSAYYLSVDSEIMPFEAPEADDLVGQDDDDWGADDADADAPDGDEPVEDPDAEPVPAAGAVPPPATAPTPPAKPTPKGGK